MLGIQGEINITVSDCKLLSNHGIEIRAWQFEQKYVFSTE